MGFDVSEAHVVVAILGFVTSQGETVLKLPRNL